MSIYDENIKTVIAHYWNGKQDLSHEIELDKEFSTIILHHNKTQYTDITLRDALFEMACNIKTEMKGSSKHYECTFDGFIPGDDSESFNKFKQYAHDEYQKTENEFTSVILYGSVGNGKTHLLHAIGNYWAANLDSYSFGGKPGVNVIDVSCQIPKYRIIRENDILLRIRNTFKKDSEETENDIYEDLARYEILAIDDVYKYQPSDLRFYQRVMFQIIDTAYNNNRGLILTTNEKIGKLKAILGEPSTDRLREMARGFQLPFISPSHRNMQNEN
jgi:DNA replication protein DnaC